MSRPYILDTGYSYTEEQLWSLDIPSEVISISELENNLDIPYLEQEGTDDWNLTPRELLKDLAKNPSHAKRVVDADLKYPIHIFKHMDQWIILDGVHRFTQHIHLGHTSISVKKVTERMLEQPTP